MFNNLRVFNRSNYRITLSQEVKVLSYAGLSMRGRRSINVNKRGVDKATANDLNQQDHSNNDAFQTGQF